MSTSSSSINVPRYVIDAAGVIRWLSPAAKKIVGNVEGRQFAYGDRVAVEISSVPCVAVCASSACFGQARDLVVTPPRLGLDLLGSSPAA